MVSGEGSGPGREKEDRVHVCNGAGVATLEETDNNHLSLEFAAVAKDAKGLPIGAFLESSGRISRGRDGGEHQNRRREISGSHGTAIRRIHHDFRSKRQYPPTDWISTRGN